MKNNIYYSVCHCKYDDISCKDRMLSDIRKEHFEKGKELKNKVTRIIDSIMYRYSYDLKYGQPMKWKKMKENKLVEKSYQNSDGSYQIITYGDYKKIIKITYYTCEHEWIKSEYFSSNTPSKVPTMILEPIEDYEGIAVYDRENNNGTAKTEMLKCNVTFDKLNLYNKNFGLPYLKCDTYNGEFFFCESNLLKSLNNLNTEVNNLQEEKLVERTYNHSLPKSNMYNLEYEDKKSKENINVSEDIMVRVLSEECDRIINKIPDSDIFAEKINKSEAKRNCENNNIDSVKNIKKGKQKYYYFGEVENNLRSGLGRTTTKDGKTIYEGEYLRDKRNGFGIYYNSGRACYAGNWKNNKRNGLGVSFNFHDNSIHVGNWNNNNLNGIRTKFDKTGNIIFSEIPCDGINNGARIKYYSGNKSIVVEQWNDGVFNNRITEFSSEGKLIYFGTVKNRKRDGYGVEYNEDGGVIYSGNWREGKYNGQGTLYFKDGSILQGEFKDGKLEGRGCKYSDLGRKIYEGEFFKNMYNGFGKLYKDGKIVYCGEFKDNERSGMGKSYIDSKIEYVGQWEKNRYNGCGVLYECGNIKYVGNFVDGIKDGRINEVKDNKLYRECIYKDDVMIYMNEYDIDSKSLKYKGNVKNGKPSGMGCLFTEYCERKDEGIFIDGAIKTRMDVSFTDVQDLPFCGLLKDTDYDNFRVGYNFVIDSKLCGGLYSGKLHNGKPDGNGTILYEDHRYTGEFKDSNPFGNGVIYKNDGTKIQGYFLIEAKNNCKVINFKNGISYYVIFKD